MIESVNMTSIERMWIKKDKDLKTNDEEMNKKDNELKTMYEEMKKKVEELKRENEARTNAEMKIDRLEK